MRMVHSAHVRIPGGTVTESRLRGVLGVDQVRRLIGHAASVRGCSVPGVYALASAGGNRGLPAPPRAPRAAIGQAQPQGDAQGLLAIAAAHGAERGAAAMGAAWPASGG